MLSEAEKQLITAGVCGHLSDQEAAELRVLLDDNPAARVLSQALVSDRDRLAALPRVPAPASVWANVTARVQSGPIVVAPNVRPSGAWLPYAVAASLLMAAAGGTYLVLTGAGGKPETADTVSLPKVGPLPGQGGAVLAENVPPVRVPEFVGPPRPDIAVAVAPTPVELAPAPRGAGAGPAPFTAALPDAVVFATVDARLPVLFPISDATDAEVVRKVKAEFAAGGALRIDLFAKDTHRAADLFATAVRAGGTQLTVDGVTQEYLKRKLQLAWGVYSESLDGPAVLAVLKRLADADAKPGVTPVWLSAHLTPVGNGDGKDAKDLFGVDPAQWKKAKAGGAPTEPLSANTADAVAATLGKPTSGAAVLTTYLPLNARVPPGLSPQIKKYHDEKPAKKDGAVPVFVVIRPGN